MLGPLLLNLVSYKVLCLFLYYWSWCPTRLCACSSTIEFGVPQGSVLVPLLLNLMSHKVLCVFLYYWIWCPTRFCAWSSTIESGVLQGSVLVPLLLKLVSHKALCLFLYYWIWCPTRFCACSSTIESGVPQGSVLVPLLLNLVSHKVLCLVLYYFSFTSMTLRKILNIISFFCRWYYALFHSKTSSNLSMQLQPRFKNHTWMNIVIHEWAYQWKLEFNPDPSNRTQNYFYSCKKSSPNHPALFPMELR